MGRPQFDSSLQLPDPPSPEELTRILAKGEGPPGPLARGPVGDDKTLMWIYVWLIQHGEDEDGPWAAAADGESEDDAAPMNGEWEIETGMTHFKDPDTGETRTSDSFRAGTPAQATAMALAKYHDGHDEIEWWSEPVAIVGPKSSTHHRP
jgi:hypothetical protein